VSREIAGTAPSHPNHAVAGLLLGSPVLRNQGVQLFAELELDAHGLAVLLVRCNYTMGYTLT